mmetsp:Transcript_26381/g.91748  ORF Transcript_26381/g.91748 Transcript_26381/m.91748 type:complete len:183 (+) Transcript_26381:681-1229(+)
MPLVLTIVVSVTLTVPGLLLPLLFLVTMPALVIPLVGIVVTVVRSTTALQTLVMLIAMPASLAAFVAIARRRSVFIPPRWATRSSSIASRTVVRVAPSVTVHLTVMIVSARVAVPRTALVTTTTMMTTSSLAVGFAIVLCVVVAVVASAAPMLGRRRSTMFTFVVRAASTPASAIGVPGSSV